MGEIIVGAEAVANNVCSRYELQRWYRSIYPGVVTARDRTVGAWLWSKRRGVITGVAASEQETRLRLLYIDAGLPRPTTQIPVVDERGWLVRILDMGWEDYMVGSEYDGEHHRTNRQQYVKDVKVWPKLARLGWNVDRVIKEDWVRPHDIVRRAWDALIARGWRPH